MARVFDNILISGLRGRVGKQLVFRVVNGVTIVSRAPEKPDRKKETEAQRKTRTNFRAASRWAKAQVAHPERKRYYTQLAKTWNLTNAYTAAVKDYMRNGKRILTVDDTSVAPNQRSQQRATVVRETRPVYAGVSAPQNVLRFFEAPEVVTETPANEWLQRAKPGCAREVFGIYNELHRPTEFKTSTLKRIRIIADAETS